MPSAPKIIRYSGVLYRRLVLAEDADDPKELPTNPRANPGEHALKPDEIRAAMAKAIEAMGGKPTGNAQHGPTQLTNGGEPWAVEVQAPVSKADDISKDEGLCSSFDYCNSTIFWVGWVSMSMEDDELTIVAEGSLSFEGLLHDDAARLLGRDDVIQGVWDPDQEQWSWSAGARGQHVHE